jgi:predicted transcriptional regulator
MTWFKFKEVLCTIEVLTTLDKNNSNYIKMFRTIKVSHTTLQNVLSNLVNVKAIKKEEIGHKNVNYSILNKGEKLLEHLNKAIELSKYK